MKNMICSFCANYDGSCNHQRNGFIVDENQLNLWPNEIKERLCDSHYKETLQKPIDIKIKKLNEAAVLPSYAKPGDAGVDLTAVSKEWDASNRVWIYGTGLAFEIPEGHVGLLFPRSSIYKVPLILSNHVGVLDSGYRGEVKFMFRTLIPETDHNYNVGDRVGQLMIVPYPQIRFTEVTELSSSERGSGGFGHSGK